MRHVVFAGCLLALLAACDGTVERAGEPKTLKDKRQEANGKITGEGIVIYGGDDEAKASDKSPLGVNSFLWRATLDTLSFMPLASADPFGGTIITDWYEDPKTPGERFKVNALILDKSLRADGIKITVFKQKFTGGWRDQSVDDKLARSLEDSILTRARQLKIKQGR